jgi:tRNA (cytidine/uridine-2'-O-)-methyltransferase
MNIVLFEPEIPQNTGNIVRTCAATGSRLHLIEPLGFAIDDKQLKRAGLDYWHNMNVSIYKNLDDFFSKNQGNFYYITTKGKRFYTDVKYHFDDYIIFGKETAGLPKGLLEANKEFAIRIPMALDNRSLNLSNSVAILVFEALRQLQFPNMI